MCLPTTLDSEVLEEKNQLMLIFTRPTPRILPESWHRKKTKNKSNENFKLGNYWKMNLERI